MQTPRAEASKNAASSGEGEAHPQEPVREIEAAILEEFLQFFRQMPTSPLPKLAATLDYRKATKVWEKQAAAFYDRYQSKMAGTRHELARYEQIWKYYRSISVTSQRGGYFPFPSACFRLQALSRNAIELFWDYWLQAADHSLEGFVDAVRALTRSVLADVSEDELACLQAAVRGLSAAQTHTWYGMSLDYYRQKTALSEPCLSKAVNWLIQLAIVGYRSYINYTRINLAPHLFISRRALEGLERGYMFFQIRPRNSDRVSPSQLLYSGIAVPPGAFEQGWPGDPPNEGCLEPIATFFRTCNFSHLSLQGWASYPASPANQACRRVFGEVGLSYEGVLLPLEPKDVLYLEQVQTFPTRVLRGDYGYRGQQRVQQLHQAGVIRWSASFAALGLAPVIFLFSRAPRSVLQALQEKVCHFPQVRGLTGRGWALLALNLPPSWIEPALTDLRAFRSQVPVKEWQMGLHEGIVEQFIRFSELWDDTFEVWRF